MKGAKTPFLTIVTRCYKKPKALTICRHSVKQQTDQDYEQVFIIDRVGRGRIEADRVLAKFKHHNSGKYVMVLDDDDMIITPTFISEIKAISKKAHFPDVIIWRGIIHPYGERDPLPRKNEAWGRRPLLCQIGSFCFAVRNEIYKRFIHKFDKDDVSDFNFIDAIFSAKCTSCWIDKVYVRTQKKSYGKCEDIA